jgi:hypothetical protein
MGFHHLLQHRFPLLIAILFQSKQQHQHSKMSNMTTISLMMILIVVVVMMFDGSCHAYSMGNKMPHANDAMQSRQNFLKTAAAGFGVMMTATPPPAWAKDQTANAGTKKDPVFEQCLSQCRFAPIKRYFWKNP